MNKSDLKTGMMVVTRDGGEYMVMLNVEYANAGSNEPQNVIVSRNCWMPLRKYSDDLTVNYNRKSEFSIMEVYAPLMPSSLWRKDISNINSWKCVWKREEPPVEMTVAEIEEKLGIKNLKVVAEHNE